MSFFFISVFTISQSASTVWYYTTLKLQSLHSAVLRVSVPYEITLLSNAVSASTSNMFVSVPYEITLLSNTTSPSSLIFSVSVPYEITLLSNARCGLISASYVSVPYEITLLSNNGLYHRLRPLVSVPYEITLLSNRPYQGFFCSMFQYLMKLHYSQTRRHCNRRLIGFSTLWNYTTLKPSGYEW